MSKIAEYRAAELELGKQLAAFEALKNDPTYKRELAFNAALDRLLDEHGIDRDDLPAILGLGPVAETPKPTATGGKRKVINGEAPKTFVNPYTGDRLTVKRLSHSKYKAWVEQYGAVTVQTWLQD